MSVVEHTVQTVAALGVSLVLKQLQIPGCHCICNNTAKHTIHYSCFGEVSCTFKTFQAANVQLKQQSKAHCLYKLAAIAAASLSVVFRQFLTVSAPKIAKHIGQTD